MSLAPKNAYFNATGSATMLGTADYGNLAGFLIGEYSSKVARATCHLSCFSFEPPRIFDILS